MFQPHMTHRQPRLSDQAKERLCRSKPHASACMSTNTMDNFRAMHVRTAVADDRQISSPILYNSGRGPVSSQMMRDNSIFHN